MTIDRNHRMHDTRGRFAPKPYGTDDDLQDMSPTELCLQLAKRRNVDMIWRSANIEVAVTFPETQEILGSINPEVEPIRARTIMTVNNLKHAWQYLFDHIDDPVDWQTISDYNRLVGQGLETNPGRARTSRVGISGSTYAPPSYTDLNDVFIQLEKVRQESSPAKAACRLFAVSCRQQWFDNGNKRTAVMSANHYLIQQGAGVFALPPERMSGEFQTQLLQYYESGELEPFSSWLQYHAVGDIRHQGLTQAQQDGADNISA